MGSFVFVAGRFFAFSDAAFVRLISQIFSRWWDEAIVILEMSLEAKRQKMSQPRS